MIDKFQEWIDSRPPKVREVVLAYPHNRDYRMRSTGQTVSIVSYSEPSDGGPVTLRVFVTAGHNVGCIVFGIQPDDLAAISDEDDVVVDEGN